MISTTNVRFLPLKSNNSPFSFYTERVTLFIVMKYREIHCSVFHMLPFRRISSDFYTI